MKPTLDRPFDIHFTNHIERSTEIFRESWRSLHDENAKFFKQRIDENMKAFERMAASRTPPEFFSAQHKWVEDTARAYGDHWAKCAQLVKDAFEQRASDVEDKVKAEHRHDARGLQRHAREAMSG